MKSIITLIFLFLISIVVPQAAQAQSNTFAESCEIAAAAYNQWQANEVDPEFTSISQVYVYIALDMSTYDALGKTEEVAPCWPSLVDSLSEVAVIRDHGLFSQETKALAVEYDLEAIWEAAIEYVELSQLAAEKEEQIKQLHHTADSMETEVNALQEDVTLQADINQFMDNIIQLQKEWKLCVSCYQIAREYDLDTISRQEFDELKSRFQECQETDVVGMIEAFWIWYAQSELIISDECLGIFENHLNGMVLSDTKEVEAAIDMVWECHEAKQ